MWSWLKKTCWCQHDLQSHHSRVEAWSTITTPPCLDWSVPGDSMVLVTSRSESAGRDFARRWLQDGETSHALLSQSGFATKLYRSIQKDFSQTCSDAQKAMSKFMDDWAIRFIKKGDWQLVKFCFKIVKVWYVTDNYG